MARNIKLLLLETIENLGIVGDIVSVKAGYARNYLLPLGMAEPPSEARLEELREARVAAEAAQRALRGARAELLGRMQDITLTLVRSTNDQGVLYGSVTQRDIADGLQENGYDVGVQSVRLAQPIRRVGSSHVPIQFDRDLKTDITVIVESDTPLDQRDEMEFDNEGELIEKKPRRRREAPADAEATENAEAASA
ncbi:MAG: 50S ribosomal protein L9 [Phycisphaerales bacterium]|nr:50S ribosomal protein L9 [Phycisphaerales bacterium]